MKPPFSDPCLTQVVWICLIISFKRLSTFSLESGILVLFWLISIPDTATPPAFAAFPGPNNIFLSIKSSTASLVDGILAPSATTKQPLSNNFLASFISSSFCVAQGKAISHLIDHGRLPSKYSTLYFSAYSEILAERLDLSSFTKSIFS